MTLVTLAEKDVIYTFLALGLLLAGAYICGKITEALKAPKVIGEIIGGMLFGGTFLYQIYPTLMKNIFQAYPEEGKVLNLFYQLGLVFLMFSSGYNTSIEVGRKNIKRISYIFTGATILPILGGIPFSGFFQKYFIGDRGNNISFMLVFVIGIAITSIPVISKIFFDIGIMNTAFSNIVLTVSTIQDLCLWILLNTAIKIATVGDVKLIDLLLVVVFTLGIFVVTKLIGNHFQSGYRNPIKCTDFYTICFIVLLICCAILSFFGINIMYSAFLVGYMVKVISQNDRNANERMGYIANLGFSLFVPIYFSLVGIQLNLLNNFSLVRFIMFFVIAFALEAIGTIIMLLFSDFRIKVIINFAVTMNARGGPGIVLATVAYSYRIINIEFFTVLILTTMLSSMLAGYWLRYQQKIDNTIFIQLTKEETI